MKIFYENQQKQLVARAMELCLDASPSFAACIDKQGRILWANGNFYEQLLGEIGGLSVRNDQLKAKEDADAKKVLDLVAATLEHRVVSNSPALKNNQNHTRAKSLSLPGDVTGRRVQLQFDRISADQNDLSRQSMQACLITGELGRIKTNPGALRKGDLSALSAKERTVAELTAQGLAAREVGEELGVAPSTVQTHLKRIYKKIGIKNKLELTTLIVENSMRGSP